MSLYGKYRPQNFTNLVGQDHVRLTILHEIKRCSFTHAYLFAGPRGTGKTSTARLIAKALNCTSKTDEGEPCDQCDFCTTIREGSLIDVIEIDAASNRGIDEIRELKEKIQFAPSRAKTKTYIIDEVHMLTKEAFNALLKTLEEPPENVYFILCTTEIHKIPETIISRCQRFDFKRIDVKTIMTRLNYIAQREKIVAEDGAIELIARHVEGGLRDAIGLFEQMSMNGKLLESHVRDHLGITGHTTIIQLLELLETKELTKALNLINQVHSEGYDLTSFVREVLECLRDKLLDGIHKGQGDAAALLEMISRFEEARDMLRATMIPQLPLEIAVIKICGMGACEMPPGVRPQKTETHVESAAAPPDSSKEAAFPDLAKSDASTQKAEAETASTLRREFELEDGGIPKHWPRVLEHVTPPSLRRSLATGRVTQTQDSELKIVFGSRFHFEKVNSAEHTVKIEKAVEHLFGASVKISCEFNQMAPTHAQEEKSPRAGRAADLAKKAIEMFGSEE